MSAILSRPQCVMLLTHWGRVTHICVGKLTIIGSDLMGCRLDGTKPLSDAGMLIGPLGTNFNDISIGIQTFSFKKMQLKMSSAKWRPFCLGLNHQAISCTNADLLSITPQWKYFSEILFEIEKISFTKMHFNISSAKCQPFCPGPNVWSY